MASGMRKWLGGGALAWLAWRMFGPEMGPRFPSGQERPFRLGGRTVIVGQREFHVREAGPVDAPPLLLIHGWVFDTLGTWHRLIPLLTDRFRVIAVDHRNHGRSERIRGRYDIEDVADETAGVMDALGLERATVVGYSMGGMAALVMARRYPGKVESVVLAATAAHPVPTRRVLTRALFALGRGLWTLTPPLMARPTYHYLLGVGAVQPHHARWLWGALLDRDPILYFEAGDAIWRFDARSWVGKIDQPAIVIIPTDDQLIPPTAQYELASLLPDATVFEVVGARHEAVLTHCEEMAKVITGFWTDHNAGDPEIAG